MAYRKPQITFDDFIAILKDKQMYGTPCKDFDKDCVSCQHWGAVQMLIEYENALQMARYYIDFAPTMEEGCKKAYKVITQALNGSVAQRKRQTAQTRSS